MTTAVETASVDIVITPVEPIYEADGTELRVQKVEQTVRVVRYSIETLTDQRAAIVRQRDEQVSARNREISEVDELLAQAAKLGLPAAVAYAATLPEPVEAPVEFVPGELILRGK